MIEELNKVLSAAGIRAGAEINWFFQQIESKEETK
jgi:hypothetical protein